MEEEPEIIDYQEIVDTWIDNYYEATEYYFYDDLENEFWVLVDKVQKKGKISNRDNREFNRIIKEQWKRLIQLVSDRIITEVHSRKTKGEIFSDDLDELDKIKNYVENSRLRIPDFSDKFIDLKG